MQSRCRYLSLAALALGLSCQNVRQGCADSPPPEKQAELQQLVGAVQIEQGGKAVAIPMTEGLQVQVGDIVTTGPNGRVKLIFKGGNSIELGPNARIQVGAVQGSTAEFGAVLLEGAAQVAGGNSGVRLAVGSPSGITEVGSKMTVFDVSLDKGFQVGVGSIEVAPPEGDRQVVAAEPAAVPEQPTPALEPLPEPAPEGARPVFEALAPVGQARLQHAGRGPWRPVDRRADLKEGDSLMVAKGGQAQVRFGALGQAALAGGSRWALRRASAGPERQEAVYSLEAGHLKLALAQVDAQVPEHRIQLADAELALRPSVRQVQAEVKRTARAGQVILRRGQLQAAGQPLMEAGSILDLAQGQPSGLPRPLANYRLDVSPRVETQVLQSTEGPVVNFVWSEVPTAPRLIELARDRTFAQPILAERISRGSLMVDGLPLGRYYWRLDGQDDSTGSLQLGREPATAECANCRRDNHIEDTGERTVVYYQQSLPALSLGWSSVAGASSYLVRVFEDQAFDSPKLEHKTQALKQGFASGQLTAGTYYWLVVALDANDQEIRTGTMNQLQLAYDNAVVGLAIRAPKSGSRQRSASIRTHGTLEAGLDLRINGTPAHIDEQGNFTSTVQLAPKDNTIVYRIIGQDNVERVYLRHVRRF